MKLPSAWRSLSTRQRRLDCAFADRYEGLHVPVLAEDAEEPRQFEEIRVTVADGGSVTAHAMSDTPTHYLSADELLVLKFAARRQLTRWANRRELDSRQRAQRVALLRAIHSLEHKASARVDVAHVESDFSARENADG